MIIEIWKDIKGFEGLYQISNYGRVKNLRKNTIVKPFDNGGYERVHLSKEGKSIKKLVHVLVAEHFISEKPFPDAQVNHKDLNRKNNHVDNLEWCDVKTNVRHAVENIPNRKEYLAKTMSAIGKKYGHLGVEASKKPVAQIDKDTGEIINVFESAREAARLTGANWRNISQVCKGQKKTHRGYKWAFVDKEGVETKARTNNTIECMEARS